MSSIFLYILQSTFIISVLYGAYFFLLRKETFFAFNRLFLISAIILSFVIPVLPFTFAAHLKDEMLKRFSLDPSLYMSMMNPSPDLIPASDTVSSNTDSQTIFNILYGIYLTGFLLFFSLSVWQLLQIGHFKKKFKKQKEREYRLYLHSSDWAPFSFFNAVFLNEHLLQRPEIDLILAHERTHINQYHSFDIILLVCVKSIHWFNPVVWAMMRSIKDIHEFLADRAIGQNGYDLREYQLLILKHALFHQKNVLASMFTSSLSKRRIDMIHRTKSKRLAKFKPLLILPLILILSVIFQNPGMSFELPAALYEKPAFITPLESGRLTRGFQKSINPFSHKSEFHRGIDIAAPAGTKVRAVQDGIILLADSVQGHGNRILLMHIDGYESYYSHLSKRLVVKGQTVQTRDIIGLVGSTGKSTAPHLHFELHKDNNPIDPAEELDISVYDRKKKDK